MKKTILIFLLLSIAAFPAFSQQTLSIDGLSDTVTVRRDARAIPYIEAKNEADLYFAQGYVTAGDRLFQMDLMRRVARGETAEIFGRPGLEEDRRWRKLGFTHICAESYKLLKPELKAAVDNYARGVNAYIATLTAETLPVEYKVLQLKPREWVPTDSLVIGKILSDSLSNTWQQDLRQVFINEQLAPVKAAMLNNQVTPWDVVLFGKDTAAASANKAETRPSSSGYSGGKSTLGNAHDSAAVLAQADVIQEARRASLEKVGMYMEDQAASNNWVISGKLTADGKAMLANDPHLQPTAPGIWYMSHLSLPNNRTSGVTFPGAPGIVLGHNEYIAWGATNLGPDVQDLYVETCEPAAVIEGVKKEMSCKSSQGYEFVHRRTEEIKVRKNPLGPVSDQEIEKLDVMETRNGVIYFESGGRKYSFRWTARDPKNTELGAFYYLNYAKDWAGFNAALKTYGGATQNFVYADVKGNIGWHNAGAIPIRRKGDGSVPYDGATADGDWTGMIPYDELPQLYNPPSGFIVTANQRVVGTGHKYFSVLSRDAAMPWRARRITDMIRMRIKPKLTMDDSRNIQLDVYNYPLLKFATEVLKLNAASPATLEAIKDWDAKTTYDSKAALIINEMRVVFAEKLADANMVDKNGTRIPNIPASLVRERVSLPVLQNDDKTWLPKGYASYKDLLLDCEKQAEANLNALAGRLKKERSALVWGDYFVANFFHPLAAIPVFGAPFVVRPPGVNGSGQTPNVGAYVSMRHIASPGNWDATRHVIPLGQSGAPLSPHFKDQFESWRTGKPEIFWFSKEAVEKNAADVTVMTPK